MESTIYTVDGKEFELQHYGVKGMRWGVRRKDRIRSSSPAYDTKTGRWTREPEGGSIRKQLAVGKSKSLKEKRAAKKALKEGYAEYQTFEKDMHNLHGSSRKYRIDKNTGKYVNSKTGKTIEDYEYKGLQSYESARKSRNVSVVSKGADAISKLLLTSLADDIFYGGAGKEAVKQTGRAAITAIVMATGGYDIKWFDKQGRRVG